MASGICRDCGETRHINADGTIRVHERQANGLKTVFCPGSRRAPAAPGGDPLQQLSTAVNKLPAFPGGRGRIYVLLADVNALIEQARRATTEPRPRGRNR